MSETSGKRPFPWREAMTVGFGVLRLSPRDFWSMTPRELAAAVAAIGGDGQDAPARDDLAGLMRLFPDDGQRRYDER